MDLNVAKPLAKPLPLAKFDPHKHSMGVRSLRNVNWIICILVQVGD
jgi:hypothetical protein